MWEYYTMVIKRFNEDGREFTSWVVIDEILNRYGLDGWEAYDLHYREMRANSRVDLVYSLKRWKAAE